MDRCPNCNSAFSGIFAAKPLEKADVDLINRRLDKNAEGYCNICSKDLFGIILHRIAIDKIKIMERITPNLHAMPIITGPAPDNWDYKIIGMVATQVTSGTGFLTDLERSVNDVFGFGSKRTETKIEVATLKCQSDLRIKAAMSGGNAIISTDIDFAEVGSGSSNTLMVCMTGTAIKLNNTEVLPDGATDKVKQILEDAEKLLLIEDLRKRV